MDFDRLQAQAQYKQDAYLFEAANERLLQRLDPTVLHPGAGRIERGLSVLALGLAITAVFVSTGLPISV